jgi:DNA-binding NarL/FixJ family response regulator
MQDAQLRRRVGEPGEGLTARGEQLVAQVGDILRPPVVVLAARAELGRAARAFEELGATCDAQRARALTDEASAGLSPARPARPAGLSARELEVLRLMAGGLSNPQIARRLIVSEFTVKRHVANILTKLDLPTRAAAAAHAAREGWI